MINEEIIQGLTKMLDNTIEANECGLSNNDFKYDIELLQSVLSLIKEQEKQIENTKALYDRALSDLVKADKQIDLMADFIGQDMICIRPEIECNKMTHDCKDCIKQYFERKVKEC